MATPLLLQAEHVAKAYAGIPALRDGRLSLRAGSVHALCGGNGAGKSTFLSILMGITQRDAGSILLNGTPVQFNRPSEALAAGIAMITQELEPIPYMTVAENIWLGREPRRAGCIVDNKALNRRTRELLESLEFDVDATSPMHRLSVAQIQLVEIAKAFSHECQVMIMDEPTSAIGEREAETLFKAIRRLTARGAGIVYVSHRLSELAQIADDYSIFRDGAFVESGRMADIDRDHLVRGIVGQELTRIDHKVGRECAANTCLQVDHLSRTGEFHDISLHLRQGEILGIYGLMGSGRSEGSTSHSSPRLISSFTSMSGTWHTPMPSFSAASRPSVSLMRTRATGDTSSGLPRWRNCQGRSRPLEGMRNTTAAWCWREQVRG